MRECQIDGQVYKNRDLTDEILEDTHLAVILTDHVCVDYARVAQKAPRIFDTRNATASQTVNVELRVSPLLEVALVDAFTAMLQCGSLSVGGEQMQRRALAFLHMMALRGPHLRTSVEAALREFLRNNPGFVGEFLQLAVVECVVEELRLTMPAGELVSSMHLAALVRNWTADMQQWQQSLGIPPARMLMVTLLHQCSPDGASRRLALVAIRLVVSRGMCAKNFLF